MEDDAPDNGLHLAWDFDDFFENSLSGYIVTDFEGKIIRVNGRVSAWLKGPSEQFKNKRFSDLLAVGGKIYFETHLWPLLRMQGYFDEVAVELADFGEGKIPVLINGYEKRGNDGTPIFMRFTIFRASDRRRYEENLQMSKKLAEANLSLEKENAVIREQFIAVLGHDLRNPLGAIMTAAQLLARTDLAQSEARLVDILQSSSKRMHEMIDNIMDLARGRLGGGIPISPQAVDIADLLTNVSEELSIAWPAREIIFDFNTAVPVVCDPARISQLVSNLLANAIIHGASQSPILLSAKTEEDYWEISVSNGGKPIPAKDLAHLFHPFHREKSRASLNGLGLGLYIASEIAKAHKGSLDVVSDEHATCFTLRVGPF
jgi:sigma-B regulation protein RsbU (phosphoserine phosphatase)